MEKAAHVTLLNRPKSCYNRSHTLSKQQEYPILESIHLFLHLAVLLFLLFPDFLHNLLKQDIIVLHCLRKKICCTIPVSNRSYYFVLLQELQGDAASSYNPSLAALPIDLRSAEFPSELQ